jgi:hypothetical protein
MQGFHEETHGGHYQLLRMMLAKSWAATVMSTHP